MACLHPLHIRVDRRGRDGDYFGPVRMSNDPVVRARTRYRDIRLSKFDVVPVPCGKCIECLKARQNALVSRALEESQKRGSFVFLTLTYSDEYLPIAQSLWRASKDTGECELVDPGEIVSSARDSLFVDRAKLLSLVTDDMRNKHKFVHPLYYDAYIDGFEDHEYVYFSRLTPSVCRTDVRLWLKRARVTYERERGHKLSPFTYVICSEYGPNTFRPHYHLAFFGLSTDEAAWLASSWSYGFVCLKTVKRVNPDGTDGFAIASRYIGKYMSKGKFDSPSVLNKCAEKPRICQSNGIGSSLIDKIRSSVLAYDVYGEYDIDTLFCPSLGRVLNESELNQLVREIPKRLVYQVNVKFSLPVPRLFRKKIFYHEFYRKQRCRRFVEGVPFVAEETRLVSSPSTIWLMVAAYIRDNFACNDEREFRARCRGESLAEIADSCASFADYQECLVHNEEVVGEETYKKFLCNSVF